MDTVSGLIAFEQGELNQEETLRLFAELIKSGLAWSLQGSYGRMASRLIELGYITREGELAHD